MQIWWGWGITNYVTDNADMMGLGHHQLCDWQGRYDGVGASPTYSADIVYVFEAHLMLNLILFQQIVIAFKVV